MVPKRAFRPAAFVAFISSSRSFDQLPVSTESAFVAAIFAT
jgi:hypothetical protein